MTPKLRRWIDLLAALLRRQFAISFEELCREVPAYQGGSHATVRRMFERDKKDLRSFGVPIETRDMGDGDLGYALNRALFYMPYLELLRGGGKAGPKRLSRYGYRTLPNLTFEPDELAVVLLAAKRVEVLGVESLTEDARSAIRKLGHDLPLDRISVDDGIHHLAQGPKPDGDCFADLSAALRGRKRVTFVYHSMDRDAVAERTVEPYGLFFLAHYWYLAAAMSGESLVKNFRLSRIQKLSVNAAKPGTPDYAIPKAFSLRDHATGRHAWELGSGDMTEVTVRVTSEAGVALTAAKLGDPVTGDPTTRRFRVRRLDAFARWILGAGGNMVPVAPAALVALYRNQVAEAAKRYDDAVSG